MIERITAQALPVAAAEGAAAPRSTPPEPIRGRAVAEPRAEERAAPAAGKLSLGERLQVARLHLRQGQVLQAENAHAFRTGRTAGTYSYALGPDGRYYVVGGSVALRASPVTGGGGEFRLVASQPPIQPAPSAEGERSAAGGSGVDVKV